MSFTYMRTEPSLWTVGERRPDGSWEPESDHGSPEEAAKRVAYLNGGPDPDGCQCDRWTAAIARVATLQSIDVDMRHQADITRQVEAHAARGDSASVIFWAGVALGIQAAKDALREPIPPGAGKCAECGYPCSPADRFCSTSCEMGEVG